MSFSAVSSGGCCPSTMAVTMSVQRFSSIRPTHVETRLSFLTSHRHESVAFCREVSVDRRLGRISAKVVPLAA